jgi:hypothetical protein
MRARSIVILCVSVFGLMLFVCRNLFQWGYWVEGDQQFSRDLAHNLEPKWNREHQENEQAFASEICGEPVAFDGDDPFVYYNLWTEQSESRHFFMYSPFSNVVWVTIGSPQYLCSARFRVTMRRHGCFWPFAYCNESSYKAIESVRLLSRMRQRPQAPPGVRPLMLGECDMGRLEPGESTKYRTDIPELGQYANITVRGKDDFAPMTHEEAAACEERRKRMGMKWWPIPPQPEVTIERNGKVVRRCSDNADKDAPCPGIETDAVLELGGGIFDITLKAPANTPVVYELVVAWNSQHGRDCPEHWDLRDKSKNKNKSSR